MSTDENFPNAKDSDFENFTCSSKGRQELFVMGREPAETLRLKKYRQTEQNQRISRP